MKKIISLRHENNRNIFIDANSIVGILENPSGMNANTCAIFCAGLSAPIVILSSLTDLSKKLTDLQIAEIIPNN
jgi:hypothetical protein